MNGLNPANDASWWASLRHVGLLLGPREVVELDAARPVPALALHRAEGLQRELMRFESGSTSLGDLVSIVLESICGLPGEGWLTGPRVGPEHSRILVSGAPLRPRRIWTSPTDGFLPVFVDNATSFAHGRGRKVVAEVLQWLRAARRPLALLTNGRQWRLIYAGLDYEAACESTTDLWFEGGEPGPQLEALRRLLQPALHSPEREGESSPLVAAILASRQGQSELSASLGERVREAVELLIGAHGEAISASDLCDHGADVYRAAVRLVMRLVVLLFAESRDLLPRANPIYEGAYGLQGLFEALERAAARGRGRLEHRHGAWPRLLALFRLVHEGSAHEALPVPAYGGELFAPGDPASPEALSRALSLFESACFDSTRQPIADRVVHDMLQLLTRSKVRVRQGRTTTTTVVPVDFSDLSSEYIGILYEGLLDYELRRAPADDPIVFLAVGDEPALPLSRLEAMTDREIASLFEKLKQKKGATAEEEGGGEDGAEEPEATEEVSEGEVDVESHEPGVDEVAEEDSAVAEAAEESAGPSPLELARTRALQWTQRACVAGGLVTRPRGRLTAERELALTQEIERTAKQLVRRVIQPGEWYLVRWGGTRKGAGTFYTRPQLAVPLAQRTLRPLAYEAPAAPESEAGSQAAPEALRPKPPEAILALQVCDPACGSGSFLVAALRFLTEAVYESLFAHGRLATPDRPFDELLGLATLGTAEGGGATRLPCRPDDPDFEERTRALLRRYVVERCLYGVDLDPLAVELCRLSLWVETMDRDLPFSFLDHKVKCGNSLVGAWFDTAAHYPAMAWMREAGDEKHKDGVHFTAAARATALKACLKDKVKPALVRFLAGRTLFDEDRQARALAAHDTVLARLQRMHELPVHDSAERARAYRQEIVADPALSRLRDTFDLWCACWFWPADELDRTPLPEDFASPRTEVLSLSRQIAGKKRFFHWELEFPEVFTRNKGGFDAILGNPPWETLQPNSKEFFSNSDPLFRAYGKQDALRRQHELFADERTERSWLDYGAEFKSYAAWMKWAATPFGGPTDGDSTSDRFPLASKADDTRLHESWRAARARSSGFAHAAHPFRLQGEGKAYTYMLFLEQGHALLRSGGRMGMLVPSGLYSDYGTRTLRHLFLDRCRWEWLFGFENHDGIFAIHRSFKFNAIVVEKGGTTVAVRSAFMRRNLDDWARAEDFATEYPKERVVQLSPASAAILEIQSKQDLDVLERIYAGSVLLGTPGPGGWCIAYAQGDFNMTSDSKLFPPRARWESEGYRPDEYSRWLKGCWQPRVSGPEAAGSARRIDIPPGVILSRDGKEWIEEGRVERVAVPLYQGVMLWQLDSCAADYVRGATHSARWTHRTGFESTLPMPQFLIDAAAHPASNPQSLRARIGFRAVQNAANQRTMIAAVLPPSPAGHSVGIFRLSDQADLLLTAFLCDFAFDYCLRPRMSQANLSWFVLAETPIPNQLALRPFRSELLDLVLRLSMTNCAFAHQWLRHSTRGRTTPWRKLWAATPTERLRLRCMTEALSLAIRDLRIEDLLRILRDSDHPSARLQDRSFSNILEIKGFWRVDRQKDPELRHTVLTLVAFHDLEAKIREQGGDREKGIAAFCAQNGGEGWMLPETLCLADYGLGHDERAKHPQPVASRLGPRFYDWQLAQDPEESWRECHLHARNLLGEEGYERLLAETASGGQPLEQAPSQRSSDECAPDASGQMKLL